MTILLFIAAIEVVFVGKTALPRDFGDALVGIAQQGMRDFQTVPKQILYGALSRCQLEYAAKMILADRLRIQGYLSPD